MLVMSADMYDTQGGRVTGDVSGDYCVNLKDFAKLAHNWLQNAPSVNIACDDIIDIQDLAVLAEHWLEGSIVNG